jgi:DNA-binding NtrC family response regulator
MSGLYRVVVVLTILLAFCGLQPVKVYGEGKSQMLTLDEAIVLARKNSVDAAVALNELKTAYWEYRIFRADLLPEMSLEANAPYYSKRYNSYQNSGGSYSFVRNNYMEMYGKVSVNQNIWFTGGVLSLESSLDFIKEFSGAKNRQYMTVPYAITLSQPVFGVNEIKWRRKIQPEKYEEAKAAFLSATEEVTMTTVQYFFNLLLAKENVTIAQQNFSNAEKLYEIAKAKRLMGKISQNDLLQLRLNMLNASATLTDNTSLFKSHMFKLRSFLNLSDTIQINPQVPESVPLIKLEYAEVLAKAQANNAFAHNVVRRQLEADYAVAQAKGNLRSVTFFAQLGYTGTGNNLSPAYSNLRDNQVVQMGFKIPLLDWGKRRGRVKVAESNREVTESKIRQETQTFNQNIFILVEQFNNQLEQLNIATEADSIAQTNAPILLTGESGTGKEMIANAIHNASKRSGAPFVKVNLGGISQSLFESEMFGHRKGAFTDAFCDREGRFSIADKGTIFLDEIGELELSCQVKLLRVLQEQTFEPLGESKPRRVDVRVVCATNADLKKMVSEHTFREDLFYRINLITINLPALRERREDIPLLVNYFVRKQCAESNLPLVEISDDAFDFLSRLPYRGNIRELKNLVERTILVTGKQELCADDFRSLHDPLQRGDEPESGASGNGGNMTLEEMERKSIIEAMEKCSGNLAQVARVLGISRGALYRRLEKYK